MITLLEAIEDPNLFRQWFRTPDTWKVWFAFIAGMFALPMTDEQAALYRQHTGRDELPTTPAEEAWLVVGRRGGKSFIMALVAVYLACFREYRPYLQPGERATVMVIAADRGQARVIMRYVRGMLTLIPLLAQMVTRQNDQSFELNNSVTIEIGTASFRATRGYTFAAVLADEIAFWRTDDSANPDFEILDAIRPGMVTIPFAVLVCASSPYARRGALWDAYHRYFGKADKPLIWKATTREMNPSVRQDVIDRAMERDAASASAEYLAEFRTDVESLLTREAIRAVIVPSLAERMFSQRHRYFAFVDPSGGSSDSMTLAIAHTERNIAMLDVIREVRPPFSPEAVTKEFADTLKRYRINSVVGDRYAGEWPRERFRAHGITYLLAEETRSELYLALVPAVNSRQVSLLDSPRLENQLIGLERRTSRGGRDLIDHAPGAHDDIANAVAGAISLALDRPVARATTETAFYMLI